MPRKKIQDYKPYLLNRIKEDENGCWIWQLTTDSHGYGGCTAWFNGKKVTKAHRLAYMVFVGEIPDGMSVCHSCDVRRCVNPEHLWVGTNADNIRDMWSKLRGPSGDRNGARTHSRKGSANGNAKLTESQVKAIRELIAQGASQRLVSKATDMSRGTIHNIVNNKQWTEV